MNPYFKRFYQYAGCNLFAAALYFLVTAICGLCGVETGSDIVTGLLAIITVTVGFFGALAFVTLREKKDAPLDWRTDLVTFSVWALLGALLALAGQAMGVLIYLFLGQALSCSFFALLWGGALGLPAGVLINIGLFSLVRFGILRLRGRI